MSFILMYARVSDNVTIFWIRLFLFVHDNGELIIYLFVGKTRRLWMLFAENFKGFFPHVTHEIEI